MGGREGSAERSSHLGVSRMEPAVTREVSRAEQPISKLRGRRTVRRRHRPLGSNAMLFNAIQCDAMQCCLVWFR